MYHQINNNGRINRIGLLALAVVVVIMIIVISFFSSNNGFRITGTIPKLNLVSIVSPFIDVSFSSNVVASGLSVTSTQNIISSYSLINQNDLRIYFKIPLKSSYKYTVKINSIKTIDSKEHSDISLNFTPSALPGSAITSQQNQYLATHQDQTEAQIYGTTLVNLLPQLGPASEFEINYQTINSVPFIVITSATEQGYQDAQSWITSQGYDLKSLNIKYINSQPY